MPIVILAIAFSIAPTARAARKPACEISLAHQRSARALFPRGLVLSTDLADRQVREAAEGAFDLLREDDVPEYDDSLLVPLYVFGSTDRFELARVERVGWANALFEGSRWTGTGVVLVGADGDQTAAFRQGSPHEDLWRVLIGLSEGFPKKLRRLFRESPVYELRLFEAPAQHVHALWLHGKHDDWFVTAHLRRIEVLDAKGLANTIDATSSRRSAGLKEF